MFIEINNEDYGNVIINTDLVTMMTRDDDGGSIRYLNGVEDRIYGKHNMDTLYKLLNVQSLTRGTIDRTKRVNRETEMLRNEFYRNPVTYEL